MRLPVFAAAAATFAVIGCHATASDDAGVAAGPTRATRPVGDNLFCLALGAHIARKVTGCLRASRRARDDSRRRSRFSCRRNRLPACWSTYTSGARRRHAHGCVHSRSIHSAVAQGVRAPHVPGTRRYGTCRLSADRDRAGCQESTCTRAVCSGQLARQPDARTRWRAHDLTSRCVGEAISGHVWTAAALVLASRAGELLH